MKRVKRCKCGSLFICNCSKYITCSDWNKCVCTECLERDLEEYSASLTSVRKINERLEQCDIIMIKRGGH